MGVIKVGTSGWADRLLLSSGWYPRSVNTPAGRLAYYAERFPLVEVDTTYYALPSVETVAAWVERTPPDFTFNVKAYRLFTGHPTPAGTLPADLRPAADRVGAVGLRRRDLPESAYDALWERFHSTLRPLVEAGKLGVVLLQFPPWLVHGDAGRRRITDTVRRCRPLRVAVELRHGSWFRDDTILETLDLLRRQDATLVCVDMPQGHPSSVPPVLVATSDRAMVRFHGHSTQWHTGDKQEKFRYAYGDLELDRWAELLRELSDQAGELHVLMNNCCGDQAQRDAARLAQRLARLPAPRSPAAPGGARGGAGTTGSGADSRSGGPGRLGGARRTGTRNAG
ncbi:MAG TPA: DUF72 domain-containing protein [Pilimelia sp.]|nr:DUF72 domain-containing protein [Pilimelia sp.]